MIKIENVVLPSPEQWEAIIRGMRNPKNSWANSDSIFDESQVSCDQCIHSGHCGPDSLCMYIGDKDIELMQKLAAGGPVHAKYRRMIVVYLDITAPLYWWKEFDTYKVGTVCNSCSTMHKIQAKEFTLDDFSCEHLCIRQSVDILKETVDALNVFRDVYLNGGILHHENGNMRCYGKEDKEVWWQMIQLLPSSYNQKRTIMLNYEVLAGILRWRKTHKLDEWRDFAKWIESLPYSELITGKPVEEKKSKDIDPNEYVKKLERSMYGVAVK